ncbi:MAG TPA: CAP domain-containing protein, partial [Thermoanaerobaculia bacterium]
MRRALSLLALLLLAAGAGRAQNDPRPELLRLLNAERQRVGAPPLRLSPTLTRAAEEHAAQIAARGRLEAGSSEEMWQRLRRADY